MKNIILFATALLLFTACEEVVTDQINIADTEALLVIEGGIERSRTNLNAPQQVRLTTTTNFLDNSPPPVVDNAEVIISDTERSYVLTYTGDGVYSTDELVPQLGTSYELEIIWEGKHYYAKDQLNEVPLIDSIYSEFEPETGITDEGYFVKINSADPAGVANFYHYRVYRNGELINLPDPGNARTLIVDDEFFDGQYRTGINPNEEVVFEPGDRAEVEQIGISESYYQFLFEIYEITGNQGIPFAGNPPPASIRGNVLSAEPENYKALGYFYTVDIDQRSVTVSE